MDPVRVRVNRIIDFGRTVSIVGIDLTSNEPVMVHVDHRPFDTVFASQTFADQNKPTVFEAGSLTLCIDVDIDADGDDTPKRAA